MRRLVAATIALLAFTGPAQAAISVSDAGAIHTIAVAFAMGDRLTTLNRHFANDKSAQIDISDWNIDGAGQALLRQDLAGHYAIKEIPFDRAKLSRVRSSLLNNSGEILAFANTLPVEGADALIIVHPQGEDDYSGLILDSGSSMADTAPAVIAEYEVDVVDLRQHKLIAQGPGHWRDAQSYDAPNIFTAPRLLKLTDAMSPNAMQKLILRAYVTKLLAVSLHNTLKGIGFEVSDTLPEARPTSTIGMPGGKPIKSVAIASAFGGDLNFSYSGAFFSNGHSTLPVPDWNIDQMVESEARKVLDGHVRVVDVAIDRAALSKSALTNEDGVMTASFPGLSASDAVDAYLVFFKLTVPVTDQWPIEGSGLEVYHYTPAGLEETYVFAGYGVALIDAHTLELITASCGLRSGSRPEVTSAQKVDRSYWAPSPPALSAQQSEQIKGAITDLIHDSVPETLRQMGLTSTAQAAN